MLIKVYFKSSKKCELKVIDKVMVEDNCHLESIHYYMYLYKTNAITLSKELIEKIKQLPNVDEIYYKVDEESNGYELVK